MGRWLRALKFAVRRPSEHGLCRFLPSLAFAWASVTHCVVSIFKVCDRACLYPDPEQFDHCHDKLNPLQYMPGSVQNDNDWQTGTRVVSAIGGIAPAKYGVDGKRETDSRPGPGDTGFFDRIVVGAIQDGTLGTPMDEDQFGVGPGRGISQACLERERSLPRSKT